MYIGNDLQIAHPSYKIIDDISSGFNGSTTSFALQVSGETPVPFPISTQQVMISVNGVVQEPDPSGSAGFKLLGSNIVFSSAPANGHAFFGVINAGADYVTAGSEFPDGSATAPSFTFQDDQDTGWFRSGSGAVGYSANGAQTLTFDGNGLTVTGDASFVGDSAKNLLWDKSDGQLEFADNARAVFGAGSDLKIYHNGSHNYIESLNGNTYLWGGGAQIKAIYDGAVEIYHDGNKKLETTSGGIDVGGSVTADDIITAGALLHEGDTDCLVHFSATDTIDLKTGGTARLTINNSGVNLGSNLYSAGKNISLGDSSGSTDDRLQLGDSQDFQIYHNGTENVIGASGGQTTKFFGPDLEIYSLDGTKTCAKFDTDNSVELYFNNSKKFETQTNGITVTGLISSTGNLLLNAADDQKLYLGASNDLQIYHDGTQSAIKDTGGKLQIFSEDIEIYDADAGYYMDMVADGAVRLAYDGTFKFETTSVGVRLSGNYQANDGYHIYLGTGNDLDIYHDGSHSYIKDNGTGNLKLQANSSIVTASDKVQFESANESEVLAVFHENSRCELYYDGTKTFETVQYGAKAGGELNFYHQSGNSYIKNDTGNLHIGSNGFISIYGGNDYGETAAKFINDGAVELYHDNSKKFETTANGIKLYDTDGTLIGEGFDGGFNFTSLVYVNELRLMDSEKILLGAGQDLQLYHDGSNSYILDDGTGDLIIKTTSGAIRPRTDQFTVKNAANNETILYGDANSECALYYDNSKKLETTSTGISITNTSGDPKILVTGSGHAELTLTTTSGSDHCSVNFGDSDDHDIGEIRYTNSSNSMVFDVNAATALTINSSQNATFAGTVSDSKGDLRLIPENVKTSAYTLIASDEGKHINISSGGVTVPNAVFREGSAVTIVNTSGSAQTITQGSSFTLYNTADATTGNRTLAGRGMCTILFVSASIGYISGAGLS